MSRFPLSLSERVGILINYLSAGNVLEFEGRRLVFDPKELTIGCQATAMKFQGGEPLQATTLIGVNMSLHRFLEMAMTLTYGDYDRMKHIMEDQKNASFTSV